MFLDAIARVGKKFIPSGEVSVLLIMPFLFFLCVSITKEDDSLTKNQ
jgi:hypothetical protein